nr:hypothetical protein [Cytophagales bacterium]
MRRSIFNLLFFTSLSACQTAEPPIDNLNQHPLFYDGQVVSKLKDSRVDEASGLAESIRYPGHFWTHNDSGDEAILFLVNMQGQTVVTLSIEGATNRDWEDIATGIGTTEGESYIYVGEIGDNYTQYPYKHIYRLKEPQLDNLNEGQNLLSGPVETITFSYADGNRDAETVMVDPQTNDIYIVSKREDQVHLYLMEYPQSLTDTLVLPVVQTLPFTRITAGDISADGSEIVIKSITQVYHWKRADKESISATLKRMAERLPYFIEPQGEAIAWLKDGSGYMTLSEESITKVVPSLYFYKRK